MVGDATQSIYEPPKSNLVVEKDEIEYQFFSVSYKKLYVMFIATFGLYAFVIFYQNWKMQKERYELRVNPVLRSFFSLFFTHSLFRRIRVIAREKEIDVVFHNNAMATLYIVCIFVSNVLDNISTHSDALTLIDIISTILMLIALYPLHVAQKVINQINGEIEWQSNSHFTIYNWVFILLGSILWLLTFFAILLSFTSVLDGFIV